MKSFLFLYPIPEYINFEIENKGFFEDKKEFRRRYKEILNKCIDLRYRQKGFKINYVIFNGHEISDIIKLRPDDNIIEIELSFKEHTTKKSGSYPYPSPDFILDKLKRVQVLRIGGFHLWDCVEKVAKRAYERGLDVLVDEDLTELLSYRILIKDNNFKLDSFPTFYPKYRDLEMLRECRKDKPWMWQY